MRRARHLTFVLWMAAIVYANQSSVSAYTFTGTYRAFPDCDGLLRHTFVNGTGESTCAQMNAVCDAECGSYWHYTQCFDNGGDPPNFGECQCLDDIDHPECYDGPGGPWCFAGEWEPCNSTVDCCNVGNYCDPEGFVCVGAERD